MVNFQISLERNQYAAGETAKGTLVISTDKNFKVQGFEFSVSGAERMEMNPDESYGPSMDYNILPIATRTRTYDESNIFFSKDLSHFLNSTRTKKVGDYDNGNSMLKVASGTWKVPFEFSIPDDALESYEGKYASIIYKIGAAANIPRRLDVGKSLYFSVFNQNKKQIILIGLLEKK